MEFSLEDHPHIELCNLLKVTGLCSSGGEAKLRIAAGQVQVDGQLETRKRCKLRAGQQVTCDGQEILIR